MGKALQVSALKPLTTDKLAINPWQFSFLPREAPRPTPQGRRGMNRGQDVGTPVDQIG